MDTLEQRRLNEILDGRIKLGPRDMADLDRYLRGESDAIDPEEKRGYELFKSHGCVACHQGVNVGGNLFQRFGVFEPVDPNRPVANSLCERFGGFLPPFFPREVATAGSP